ncbi:MAG: hypothetical protein ACYC1C_10250 [Chloroflexota bacterium]
MAREHLTNEQLKQGHLKQRRDSAGEAKGTLVLVQEDRFRLQEDDGRSLLFVLGTQESPSLEELESWAEAGRAVRVRYRGSLEEGPVAQEVRAL